MQITLPRQKLYYLILLAPFAILARMANADPGVVFVLSAIALVPLAKLIGDATEELAVYTGPKLGGLLNATLGNAAELIITIFALRAGLLDLVRASITGSIIGNLLIVLGLSLLLGGLKNGVQKFDRRTAGLNATLLILSVVALAIPSLFDVVLVERPEAELLFSEGVAIILIVLYGLSVLYSFRSGAVTAHGPVHEADLPAASGDLLTRPAAAVHEARWTRNFSLIVLALATVGTALVSEALVGAVEPVPAQFGLSEFFVGIIIIPLVGNIAEHLVAVQVAIKNQMELSLAVSLGSSIQIALFVAPVLVFVSLLFDDKLLLVFNNFELIVLIGTAVIAAFIALDGESNWFEGAMLLGVYLIIALAFLFLPAEAAHTVAHP
ncbi:calcium/proton exchanger [Anaerolineae bacterium CFX9]|nr:calcium/proton exchanger [Anaerolineae bacterium CFX9]